MSRAIVAGPPSSDRQGLEGPQNTRQSNPSRKCRSATIRAKNRPCQRQSNPAPRSEEHTSELQSLMRISYAVFCLKKKNNIQINNINKSNRTTYYKLTTN